MILCESRICIDLVTESRSVIFKDQLPACYRIRHLFPSLLQQILVPIKVTDGILVGVIGPIQSTVSTGIVDIADASARIYTSQTAVTNIVFGIHIIVSHTGKVHTTLKLIGYLRMTGLTFTCLDQNYTIVGTRSVNGSRSGIFKDLD